jgi:hypothetical protein
MMARNRPVFQSGQTNAPHFDSEKETSAAAIAVRFGRLGLTCSLGGAEKLTADSETYGVERRIGPDTDQRPLDKEYAESVRLQSPQSA